MIIKPKNYGNNIVYFFRMIYLLYYLVIIPTISAKCQWSYLPGWSHRTLYNAGKITCDNINSDNIHKEIALIRSTQTDSLPCKYIFLNSSIPNFPMDVFTSHRVDFLYLNNSKIETIQTGAFSGLSQLQEIYLQHNLLSVISRGCFNSLVKLKIIDLSNNLIHLIEDDSFHGSSELQKIFLGNNKITAVPELLFESLKLLQMVDLSGNSIKELDFIFTNFKIYKSLYLDNNEIGIVDCKNLKTSFLDVISLKNNALTEFDASCFPSNLEEIYLNNNTIAQINNVSLLQGIKHLDLSYNGISRLKNDELRNLKNMKSLKLQSNILQSLEIGVFKDLSSLTSLNLSSNLIEMLDFGVFAGMTNLNSLDLSHNELLVLEEDIFQNLQHLNALNVSHNNLQYLNLVKLASYSSSLKQIDLNGNNITCQKLASMFSYRINIRILNGTHYNVPNVNGISCTNINYMAKSSNDVKLNNNIFQEMRLFFNADFKNTTFFKFFSDQNNSLNDALTPREKQSSPDYYILLVIICLFVVISCVLLLVLVFILSKFVFKQPTLYRREPELSLL